MKLQDIYPYLPWVIGGSLLGYLGLKKKTSVKVLNVPMPSDQGAPFAMGSGVFPVGPSNNKRWGEVAYKDVTGEMHGNSARRFKANRPNNRWHAGIDLYADHGDTVLAPEGGVVVGFQNFLNTIAGKDAMLIQGDSGTVYLLGEIEAGSWEEFGLAKGSIVGTGQPVARVGVTSNGSHMLHFETYTAGTTKNTSWYRGSAPPPNLLDPTYFLLASL